MGIVIKMIIRPEKPEDIIHIRSLNEMAFGRPEEAELIDRLRTACADHISLVAEDNSTVVGHIMFTPVVVSDGKQEAIGMGLAPMAVLPSRQRQGIGSLLVRSGLEVLQDSGCTFVAVLGYPDFYPRFGFKPASEFNIKCQWDGIPNEAFMILVLDRETMRGVTGTATFRDEFNEAL